MDASVKPLTRSALAAAAGVAILYIGSLLPTMRLSILCAATLGVVFVRMSCSVGWALGCYAVTAAAGLLLLPEKILAVVYAVFMGYYPVVKLWAERRANPIIRWGIKLAVFNAAAFLLFYAFSAVFFDFTNSFLLKPWFSVLLGNGVFVVYDYALGVLILYYMRNIARRIDHG